MKKIFLTILFLFFINSPVFADIDVNTNDLIVTYTDQKANFGLKNQSDNTIVTKAIYTKLIRLGDTAWIVQKGHRFGIIDNQGNYIVKPKYSHAERYFGKYVKLGNRNDFGVYDSNGAIIVEPKYKKIDLLYGRMFLTYRNYKYGITDLNGNIILDNVFDEIYMPTHKVMRLKLRGEWFEIERIDSKKEIELAENASKFKINDKQFKATHLVTNTGIWSGYSALTLSDYIIKILSSLSPAYEDTIDELMLSHGTDTVSIFIKMSWLPKFPVTYAQKYYDNFVNPKTGPLSEVRENVKKQIK